MLRSAPVTMLDAPRNHQPSVQQSSWAKVTFLGHFQVKPGAIGSGGNDSAAVGGSLPTESVMELSVVSQQDLPQKKMLNHLQSIRNHVSFQPGALAQLREESLLHLVPA